MRTNYSIIAIFFAVVLLAGLYVSCNKLKEDPKASLTPGTYFQTQSDLDAAVAGMYIQLARDGAWGFTSKETSYFGSDDLTTDPALNKEDQRNFDRLLGNSDNQSLEAQWQGPWNTIYNANNILANYQKITSTQAQKNASAGQAYFLRGLCYYYLVRTFGSVPLVLTPISVSDRPLRASVDSVYGSIISDLEQAENLLGNTVQTGMPNTYSASAILADVYLTKASYYKSDASSAWTQGDAKNYDSSVTEANKVMQSGLYKTLGVPYDQIFTTNNSPEAIFSMQYSVAGNLPQRSWGATNVPIDEYGLDGSNGWDDVYPEVTFFKNAPICNRTNLTFYTTLKLLNANKTSYTLVPWNSPLTHARHPYYLKFRAGLVTNGVGDGVVETDSTIVTIQPSTNKSLIVIRYAQVLLDYAEASDMSGGGPASASYNAINQVRERAGEPDLVMGLSQIAFRDSVVHERAYECAGEFGVRWFDIVRLQLLPQIIAVRDTSENPIPAGTNVQQKYLAPIPIGDINLDPGWAQNPGY